MRNLEKQLELFSSEQAEQRFVSSDSNNVAPEDKAFHEWYRFVLSFPPHLVRRYLSEFELGVESRVLDPFCGTGTTLVEAKLRGFAGVGLEANAFPFFASSVKVDWSLNPDDLLDAAWGVADEAKVCLRQQGIDDTQTIGNPRDVELRTLDPAAERLLIANSISPFPLHKTLVLLECLKSHEGERYYGHALLALGKALVSSISNLRFGPEVGVGKQKPDVPVIASWLNEITCIVEDLRTVQGMAFPEIFVRCADARTVAKVLEPLSIDAVITSPPYPNEKDYTRTTRLESVLLGFYNDRAELRHLKQGLVRSNTRNIYKADDDDRWVQNISEIQNLADEIEQRRIALGKTSGFERLYARLTRLYFGGMAKHLAGLRSVLRPGARLAYVVGDQASYFRVMIRTGQLLALVAKQEGYEVERIDLFRTRFATATKQDLREEVVVLRWPG